MVTQTDLEKRVNRLKDRIQKAGEGGERPLPPDRVVNIARQVSEESAKTVSMARTCWTKSQLLS